MDEALLRLSALEALEELLLGYTVHHRRDDAWDLIDAHERVAAVICVRKRSGFLTISLPSGPERRALRPTGPIVMPYDEEVIAHITPHGERPRNQHKKDTVNMSTAQGRALLAKITAVSELTREEGTALAVQVTNSTIET